MLARCNSSSCNRSIWVRVPKTAPRVLLSLRHRCVHAWTKLSFLWVIHIEKVLDRVSSLEKGIVLKPDDLISVCRTHRWRREPTPANCPLTSTHMLWHMHTNSMLPCIHVHTHTMLKKKTPKNTIFFNQRKNAWLVPSLLSPPCCLTPTYSFPAESVCPSRRVLEHWRTRRSVCAGKWVSRSTGSLWASWDSRQRRHCVSWELLGAVDAAGMLGGAGKEGHCPHLEGAGKESLWLRLWWQPEQAEV